MSWLRSLVRHMRQSWCSHAIYYDTDMKPRDAEGMVRAPCYKCGKLLVGDCGLALGASLHRRNR